MRSLIHPLVSTLALAVTAVSVQAETIYATTAGNSLVKFDSATPGVTTTNLVTGLAAGENLLGIDFRLATGALYGLGSSNRLYTIDLVTAAATAVGSPFSPVLEGVSFGFDFNPTVDRIRITSNTAQNLRANPDTGAISVDTEINPTGTVVGSAYDRNDFDPTTSTDLYVIDSGTDRLLQQGGEDQVPSANTGILTLIGELGVDTTDFVGFDISSATAIAYATLTAPGSFAASLYTINLDTGAATLVANGNTGLQLTSIAVAPIPIPGAAWLLGSGLFGLVATRRRRAGNVGV